MSNKQTHAQELLSLLYSQLTDFEEAGFGFDTFSFSDIERLEVEPNDLLVSVYFLQVNPRIAPIPTTLN